LIVLLLALILFAQERIYSGHLSYAPLEQVVTAKKWRGTEVFDILLATPNCNDVSKWTWVIVDGNVLDGLIVDCSNEWDDTLGLVADCDRLDLVHKWAFIVVR